VVRWLKLLVLTLVVFVLLSGILLGVAEHRTSQPEFCGSCHIMKPYYESWHADLHGGKLEVACVECHYAPGEQTTIKAKLRGLSQVASYFSGRYGTSRPRAHVANSSCLTSKCHGDMRFMDKEIRLGTVTFIHAKHLKFDEEKKQATERDLEALTEKLRGLVGQEQFEELKEVACEAVPAKVRKERMKNLVRAWNVKVTPEELAKFSQLEHREVRIAQLADLQCTNCHSYVAPNPNVKVVGEAHHFTVKTTTCFTCHFNNQDFNTGTASCLLCHEPPTKEILVHPTMTSEEKKKLPATGVGELPIRMNHQAMLDRKVNCIACHADVASQDSTVTRRDCQGCHDRPEYFQEWKEPATVDLIKRYHDLHVPQQRAKCLDCHSEIHHQLARDKTPGGQPAFLSSVMSDCKHCHPNQHTEQIELLSGTGGEGVPKGTPNLMFGARTNCFGCHLKQATTEHGSAVYRGSLSGCIACHGDSHSDTFEKWKKSLQVLLMDAEDAYTNAQKMLEGAKDIKPEVRQQATNLLSGAHHDLLLVKRGNGVHNVMYAIDLLDSITQRCQQAVALVSGE
jgi:nitrate/TMAO reductase-like tetraheme cytochrome c subunit